MKVPKDRLEVWGGYDTWEVDLIVNYSPIATSLENKKGICFWGNLNQAKKQAERFSKCLGNIPIIVVDNSE